MRALFFGAITGMAVGVLNLVAVANEWDLKYAFEAPDDPIMRFMGAAQDWAFVEMPSVLMIIGYWTLIGLLLALVFCFVRVARMRKGAAETRVSGECLSGE